jgi:hypothetical protein
MTFEIADLGMRIADLKKTSSSQQALTPILTDRIRKPRTGGSQDFLQV